MTERIRLGMGRYLLSVPPWLVDMKGRIARDRRRYEAAMEFMSDDHRKVHHFTVKALPGAGGPLSPGTVAAGVGLSRDRVVELLDDLQKHMTFLFRNTEGLVTWAYPVTADRTPHHLTFSTGEEVNAA